MATPGKGISDEAKLAKVEKLLTKTQEENGKLKMAALQKAQGESKAVSEREIQVQAELDGVRQQLEQVSSQRDQALQEAEKSKKQVDKLRKLVAGNTACCANRKQLT